MNLSQNDSADMYPSTSSTCYNNNNNNNTTTTTTTTTTTNSGKKKKIWNIVTNPHTFLPPLSETERIKLVTYGYLEDEIRVHEITKDGETISQIGLSGTATNNIARIRQRQLARRGRPAARTSSSSVTHATDSEND